MYVGGENLMNIQTFWQMIPLTVAPHLVHKVIVGAHGEPTDGPGRVNGNLLIGRTGFGDRGCGVHLDVKVKVFIANGLKR